jgi:orotate phosphoribosyltransferase
MQAYMNMEAALKTLTTGEVTYWSTGRARLWRKGETSGFTQALRGVNIDCDGDAVILEVRQKGPACHTGLRSCFDTETLVDQDELRRELIGAIKDKALTLGDFTLTSGKKSDFTLTSGKKSSFYLDIKKIITDPGNLAVISRLISDLHAREVDVIAGPELGAIPIVVSVAMRCGLPFAMIRKGERSHGTGKMIEGELKSGDRVLLIDDVTTSGGSLAKSVEAIRSTGAQVTLVTCVVDRMEGAQETLRRETGVDLAPLLTLRDLGIEP